MQDTHQGPYLGPFTAGLKTVSLPGDVRNEPPLRFKELFGGLVDGVDHSLWAGCKNIKRTLIILYDGASFIQTSSCDRN